MGEPRRLIYTPRPNATPEGEIAALAAVYRFVFERYQLAKAASENGGEEKVRKEKYVSRNQTTR